MPDSHIPMHSGCVFQRANPQFIKSFAHQCVEKKRIPTCLLKKTLNEIGGFQYTILEINCIITVNIHQLTLA